ncbi:MAG: hypothetical protein IKA50_03480 [Clostridia bacterium]|nr:hypothetical protein [Clostridia bacterium]
MKNVKKLLALLLAMAMLVALCACGDDGKDDKKDDKKEPQTTQSVNADHSAAPSTAPTQNDTNDSDNTNSTQSTTPNTVLTDAVLQGDWKASINMEAMTSSMGEEIAVFDTLGINLGTCTIDMAFNNGKATFKSAGLVDWYVDIMEQFMDWATDSDNFLEYMALTMSTEDQQYTAEDIRAMLAEEGVTIEELIDEAFAELDAEAMAQEMADELGDEASDYTLDGNKLIFDDAVMTFTYSDGKIYVTSVDADDEIVTFNKGDFVLEKK